MSPGRENGPLTPQPAPVAPRFSGGRGRRTIAVIAIVSLIVGLFAGPSDIAAAELNYAGVVVRHDGGRMSYGYVGFAEDEINGIELLRRTGLDVVTVRFGGLGEGVCSIDETGCPSSDCRQRVCQGPGDDDPFWRYFRQATPGDWQALVLGASSTKVRDGDLDGWAWTPDEAGLPALSLDDVARLAGFDGTSFEGANAGEPGAALHREGAPAGDDEQPLAAILAGAGLLLAAVAALAWLSWRRRQREGAG